jgi:hypothetical protein
METRQQLRDLKTTDPDFYKELIREQFETHLPAPDDHVNEDDIIEDTDFDIEGDNSSIGVRAVVADVIGANEDQGTKRGEEGGLLQATMAEDEEQEPINPIEPPMMEGVNVTHAVKTLADVSAQANSGTTGEMGHSKRSRKPNQHYAAFIRHNDDESSDVD